MRGAGVLGFFSRRQASQYSDLAVKIALHLRQGLGKILIFTPAFTLEVDSRCRVIGSRHYLPTVDADWFVFLVCYASDDC